MSQAYTIPPPRGLPCPGRVGLVFMATHMVVLLFFEKVVFNALETKLPFAAQAREDAQAKKQRTTARCGVRGARRPARDPRS